MCFTLILKQIIDSMAFCWLENIAFIKGMFSRKIGWKFWSVNKLIVFDCMLQTRSKYVMIQSHISIVDECMMVQSIENEARRNANGYEVE